METVTCPYCGSTNHTSSPESMAECAYCGIPFAEVHSPYQRLTILDNRLPDAWSRAETLSALWEASGELDHEVIVDRRIRQDPFEGDDRRHFAGAGLPLIIRKAG